jgi:hypothetical protein
VNEFVYAPGSTSLEEADETLEEEGQYYDVGSDKKRNDKSTLIDGSIQVTVDRVPKMGVAALEIGWVTQYEHVNEHTHDEGNGDGDVREDGAEIAA